VASLTVVAGPNGSGKSTLTSSIWFEGNANLIDPDSIARRLDSVRPARAAFPAAREAILRCKELLANRTSFTLETTLAGHGAISMIMEAKNAGYETYLIYVALGDPDLHIERVRLRVLKGATISRMPTFAGDTLAACSVPRWRSGSPTRRQCWTIRASIPYECSCLNAARSFGVRMSCRDGLNVS
jgi:AAA domain